MLSGRWRSGATLAELLVALTLAAIVLGAATSTLLGQRRTAASLGRTAGGDAQLRAALGAVTVEVGALSAGSGDLAPDQASDTALELRSLVASGLSCGDEVGSATFASDEDDPAGSFDGAPARVGDSLWWFGVDGGTWRGRRIAASDSVVAPCLLTSTASRASRRVAIAERDSIPYGTPLRITRPVRYTFYRGGDGSWQLGLREWSEPTGRFASPQPVAGPFLMKSKAGGTGFRYYDAEGRELGGDGVIVPTDRVARVRVSVIGADAGGRRDSADVALQPRRVP